MAKKILVGDWDNTFTLAKEEVGPFRTGCMEDLAALVDEEFEDIRDLCLEIEQEILQNPEKFSVMNKGLPAIRANDPYCIWDPIARRVFDCFKIFQNEDDQTRIIDNMLFKYNCRKTTTVFNPQAKYVLKNLITKNNQVETFIVSSSGTDHLRARIRLLSRNKNKQNYQWVEKLANRAYGSAKKFHIDNRYTIYRVPESLEIPGLNRLIYLRRPRYYEVLASILKNNSGDWNNLIVVGDSLETDLILPYVLGAKIGLVVSDITPKYEIDFVQNSERGFIVKELKDIFKHIGRA